MLSFIGSICAPYKATLKAEAHALECTTAGPYNAIPTSLLGVGSVCGLGPGVVGIHSISLAARCRTAACSNTLNRGLEKIQAARAYDFTHVLALSPIWEKEFIAPSMARCTSDAFDIVCRLDRDGKLDEASRDKKQKVATGLLRDKLYTQNFAGPISSRASKVLGPISHYRIADILPHMKLRVLLVLGSLLAFFSSFATGYARLKDFTQRVMNKCVVLDVRMNPTPSSTSTKAIFCLVFYFHLGTGLLCFHEDGLH